MLMDPRYLWCFCGFLVPQLGCESRSEPPLISAISPEPRGSVMSPPHAVPADVGAATPPKQLPRAAPPCGPLLVPPDEYRIEDAPRGRKQVSGELDLDGDGVRDRLVTAAEFCAITTCVYAIYLHRKGCGQYVGVTLGGGEFTRLPARHSGLYDFEARNGRMGNSAFVHYRYDGTEYVGSEQRICLGHPRLLDDVCGDWMPLGDVRLPVEWWDQPGVWPFWYADLTKLRAPPTPTVSPSTSP
jgi:hypothetical protein